MRKATCPICKRKFNVPDEPASRLVPPYPFCSQRCRDADLGRWLNEGYSVPVETERVVRETLGDGGEEPGFTPDEE